MRKRIFAVASAVALAVVAFGSFAPADAGPGEFNTFTVVKEVNGPVPQGAVFEVRVTCEPVDVSPGDEGLVAVATFEFDETGSPIGDNSVPVSPFEVCSAEETVTNGASVTYACEVSFPPNSPAEGIDEPATCVDDQTILYERVSDADGVITVTNTFAEEPPPDVDDDVAVNPDVVTATPAFTG